VYYAPSSPPLFRTQQFDLVVKLGIVSDAISELVVSFYCLCQGITHTDMVQLGFIRSLARFFLDTQANQKKNIDADSLKSQHTIDELYQLAHPDWSSDQVKLYSYPLKSIIDQIQVRDALVDLNPATKNLPSAHFDSESFVESNQRIINLRKKSKNIIDSIL
jgi:hypothetical protein